MGLIKTRAGGLPSQRQVAAQWKAINSERWEKTEQRRSKATYHFVELVSQLFDHNAQTSELLEHSGNVVTCVSTDRLDF